ncbi:MAG: ribonuclease Y [Anaerolineae bacterium CG2_30_64_16]|nr:MAG: ribonuclease Y [Anaerolineae bacterium CG2_30_64_16]
MQSPGRLLIWTLVDLLLAGVAGAVIGYLIARSRMLRAESEAEAALHNARAETDRILARAESQAKSIELSAQERRVQIIEEAEAEIQRRRRELERSEERIQRRQETVDSKLEQLEVRDRKLNQRQSKLDKWESDLSKLEEQHTAELERIASMSREDAKQELLVVVERGARQDMARKIREVDAETQAMADERAREIITRVMERVASDHISETTVSSVPLPNDEMKGRIIGRQGRNIRAIENATGVDLVVDDTPEAVIISSFDPIRREVARLTLSRLVQDGRIHPARVEQEVEKAQQEVDRSIRDAGEQAVIETGLQGLHPEIVKLLGRLKYRTSYGQNQLSHAIEATHIASMLAAELGANVQISKMGALLHDLGKAVSHEVDGPHAQVGADIAKRYGVSEAVINIIASHHHEVEQQTVEAVIVATADAISGARPGARREALETYVKRIKALEDLGNSFSGVAQTYAIQAGREIRIIVKPEEIDDLSSITLAKEIAKKIEDNLEYPGQIKVTVVRETRAVEMAK